MEWFQGELTEAISSVKSSRKILLVFVFGKDEDTSKDFLSSLEACADSTKDYLCLKLEASSLGAAQFNAFYPVMVVPLIYFINHEGTALESICGRTTRDEIRAKLSIVESLVEGADRPPEADEPHPPISVGAEATDSLDGAELSADIAVRRSAAQQQLAENRIRKEKEEKEKEKEKEKERREVGQRMAELKRFQREQELKELREEIAKKRNEERNTRERIRRQIEEDRRERMARNAPSSPPSTSVSAAHTPAAASSSDGDTRLQFRLPDGSNVVHIFRVSAPLSEAFDFITGELNGRLGGFRISSLYPRRLFGPEDMQISLLDLALTPSAALVVMPDRAGDGGNRGGHTSSPASGSLVEFALTPVMLLWGIICSIFAAFMNLLRRPTVETGDTSTTTATHNAARERRLGGINRLSDLPRDDDDVNTWNGNSTQQK